jgi:hypothetical protein
MPGNIRKSYGPYSKNKKKTPIQFKERRFLQRTYEWLKWKITDIGGFAYHTPCLEK